MMNVNQKSKKGKTEKYPVKYFIEDHPKSELKIIDSKTGKIESENDDDDNEMIIHVHIKQEPNDFEFIEVEDIENNEKKIVSQKKHSYEYDEIEDENGSKSLKREKLDLNM